MSDKYLEAAVKAFMECDRGHPDGPSLRESIEDAVEAWLGDRELFKIHPSRILKLAENESLTLPWWVVRVSVEGNEDV